MVSILSSVSRAAGIAAVALALFTATPAHAAPTQFVETLGQEALSVLANKDLSKEQSLTAFKKLMNDHFDIPAIGRFVLGRYWSIATPAEQQEYQRLFQKMVEQIYSDRFSLYSGEMFKVGMMHAEGDQDTIVESQIVRPNGPPVNVEWRVTSKKPEQYRISDVIVEGVSMSVTQRAEFASVIQRGGGTVESLLKMMREKTGAAATTAAQ